MNASVHYQVDAPYLVLDGVEVGLSYNDEEPAEMFVNVSTAEADEPAGREWPALYVMLNDALLHAPEKDTGPKDALYTADVIARLQAMRDEFNVPPADNEQTREDFLTAMDSEEYGRYQALGTVLDVIYLMAKGIEPAQGAQDGPEHCACGRELYVDGHCPDGGAFCG